MSLPDFDPPESDHAEQASKLNSAHRDSVLQALRTLEYRAADPLLTGLQHELKREKLVLSELQCAYDSDKRETNCSDLHLQSVIDLWVARVERAQLRVNLRAEQLTDGRAA